MQTETMLKFPSAKVTTDVQYGKSSCVTTEDAYIEFRCEQLMDMIRSARMKKEFSDIESKNDETALQPEAAGQFFLFSHIPMR